MKPPYYTYPISVITVVLNGEKTIRETIESVLAQSYFNFEYIVIDGQSKDGTLDILKSYESVFKEKNVAYHWTSEADTGIYSAMNKGISSAKGELICIINSDDWLERDTLRLFVEQYKTSDQFSVLIGDAYRVNDVGEYLFTLKNSYSKFIKNINYTMPISHPSVCVPAFIYRNVVGSFNTDYKILADYDFIYRCYLAKNINFVFINKPVANFRTGGISDSFNPQIIYLRATERFYIRKQGQQQIVINYIQCVRFFVKEFLRQFMNRYFSNLKALKKHNNLKKALKNNQLLFDIIKRLYLRLKLLKHIFSKDLLLPQKVSVQFNIQEKNKHIFFGYYDKSPWNLSMEKMIYHEVDKKHKSIANIGIYDCSTREKKIISCTKAWNWQQGSMLQWLSNESIIYNIYHDNGQIVACSYNIHSDVIQLYSKPVYVLDDRKEWYLSLNFYRLFIAKSGYGYRSLDKNIANTLNDNTDGVWLCSIKNQEKEQFLFSIHDVKCFGYKQQFDNSFHYVNHLSFCPGTNDFILIHRWQNTKIDYSYHSRLLLYNIQSKTFKLLLDNDFVSHYCWFDAENLLIYATDDRLQTSYLKLNIRSCRTEPYLPDLLFEDGHPSYNNDRSYLLTDTYPDSRRVQKLILVSQSEQKLKYIGNFYSPVKYINTERCDLHPRWSPDNLFVVVDTTCSGYRTMCILKV
jgi:glycosyltransferase involved in cell wall biosynthesis